MASENDQLATDFNEVQKTLELYPNIELVKTEGDPPDSFEIAYHFQGYVRNNDGSIRQDAEHRIRINLPFGYPHFPPTVKPLTSIFHPDIDPDAVRIADYWQKTPSLPELILHIGEMICGKIYNLDNPFNQEAADWYIEHREELPLDSLQSGDSTSVEESFDVLDDNFDVLGIERDEEPDNKETLDAGPQLDLIRLRIEQKEMFAAGQLLNEIPAAAPVPDRNEIEHVISAAKRDSENLLKRAERLEDDGKLDGAMELLERAAEISSDTPGLEDTRLRLQQAQVMAETLSDAAADDEAGPEQPSSSEATPKKAGKTTAPKIDLSGVPLKPILAVVVVIALVAVGAIVYFRDTKAVQQGQSGLEQASQLLRKKQFQGAENSAREAQNSLNGILVLRSKKQELQAKLNKLLNSTDLKQGLQGALKYNNQYLPRETVEELRQLDKMTDAAKQLQKSGNTAEAITAYESALEFARKKSLQPQAATIRQTINNLSFAEAMVSARQAENAQEWQNAAKTYKQALSLAKDLSDTEGAQEVSKKLAAATFRHELDQSKASFTDAQWQQTIAMLEDAHNILDENPDMATAEERRELDRLLADSRLYQTLALAKKAYEDQQWDAAIAAYQKAVAMIRDQQEIFAGTHDSAVKKIKKTMLLVQIAREQAGATEAAKENDLKAALVHYRAIEKLIATPLLSDDPNIAALKENTRSQIKNTADQLAMNEKVQWLEKNFEQIFKATYPSSRSSELSRPKLTFIKKINGREIYNLSCVELNRGRSSRLELNYQYDPSNDQWSKYSGQ